MSKLLKRSYYSNEINLSKLGEELVVNGWVSNKRNLGSLVFIDLRDREGIIQLVFDEELNQELYEKASKLGREYVIGARGLVRKRSSVNPELASGEVEIDVSELEVFSKSQVPPIHVREDDGAKEELRLKYRYLDLRKKKNMDRLRVRSKINKVLRDYLYQQGFTEFETPILNKTTPEGARDYLVPSRVNPGKFYALPQSPQIFKQLLMISGADRYYQITRCFRDEDLRADRQPEFTQLDLEMSFVDQETIMELNEGLMAHLFKEIAGVELELPLRRMSYEEAMDRYGSDKPDTRFGLELLPLEEVFRDSDFNVFAKAAEEGKTIRGIFVEGEELFSNKELKKLEKAARTYGAGGLATVILEGDELKGSISKFLGEKEIASFKELSGNKNGTFFIVSDEKKVVQTVLGNLRGAIAKDKKLYDPKEFDLLWVIDFPAFHFDEESGRHVAEHHPFTMLNKEDLDLLDAEPTSIRANSYDLVVNGFETASGSIRIHDSELQAKVFKTLGFTEEEVNQRFGFFIEALKYGTPPHGGIAYGLDRLTMIFTETDNIRDVIAFPKSLQATCLMSEAPSYADDAQLAELHIKVVKNEG
ncbi:MAG: aspartate--tRNA ligase [Tissierellia bacterium]|nr:aspartate--tRNA ligase [Tissierellia bacterium]